MTGIDTIGAQARPQHDPVQRLSGRTASSMDADPLVSVIIPCYNGEAFLKEAIESALAQRYPPDPAISPGIVDPDALANDAGAGRAQSHNLHTGAVHAQLRLPKMKFFGLSGLLKKVS
jgi:cellulose synthase/poly-beta-1,6-N-acetylglucosamine synthase-like glycosyltransferase